jgi:predicted O-linked N-acetylglucosamine transferase (SPINDLY family)
VGASLLHTVGLSELVADSEEGYIGTAAALAGDRPRLRSLRAGLGDRLRASPLLDAPGFVRTLEDTYLELRQRAGG